MHMAEADDLRRLVQQLQVENVVIAAVPAAKVAEGANAHRPRDIS